MCDRLASAWVAFARTGDPNCEAIPHWAPYNATERPTMVFDSEMTAENDPRGEIRRFWDAHAPAA
jgi:para-nitrobenzyl esterase